MIVAYAIMNSMANLKYSAIYAFHLLHLFHLFLTIKGHLGRQSFSHN